MKQPRRQPARRESRPAPQPSLKSFRSARELACHVLLNSDQASVFVPQQLDEELRRSSLSVAERRLATELVFGVVRRQNTLDCLLRRSIHRPWTQVERLLQFILRLGAYQLFCLDRVPVHAAMHETVELCTTFGNSPAKGFVNGVLRGLLKLRTAESCMVPSRHALPLTAGNYLTLAEEVFPDPNETPATYFEQAFSFPEWLATRWAQRFSGEKLWELGFSLNSPPFMTLRINTLQVTPSECRQRLEAAGISAEQGVFEETLRLQQSTSPLQLPGWSTGDIVVQDETAQRASRLLAPQPGERVWDVCAAPGGKTTHLAALMQNQGRILATDTSPQRLEQVVEVCQRLKTTCVEPRALPDVSSLQGEEFDAALADVPCSNTGVLGKRPEARWRISPTDLQELPSMQGGILYQTALRVRPGGRLVYSTCSIEPEENREVVQRFLQRNSHWKLTQEQEYLPTLQADGGYQALLTRDR